jgi:hypothetical protein
MADVIYAPSQFRMAIAEESTFGTANSTQTEFYELDLTIPTRLDLASGMIEDTHKRSDGSRMLAGTDTFRDTGGGLYVIPFECIATRNTLDLLLYGVMQDIISDGTDSPFQCEFEWDSTTTGPDFSTDAGKFFTILGEDATNNWEAKTCVLRSLTLSASPGTNGGRLTASGEFVTGFIVDTSSVTATVDSWVSPITGTTDFFPFQAYQACTIDGDAIVPYSFSVTFNNNAVRSGHDTSKNATNYHMPQFDLNMEIVAKLDAVTEALEAKYILNPTAGSAEEAVVVTWGGTGVTGYLNFAMNAIYDAPLARDFGAESGVGVTLAYSGRATGAVEGIEVSIASAVDRDWVA